MPIIAMCFTGLMVLVMMPFIRPFKISRLIWTYAVPLTPLLTPIDGTVSCLRTYSVDEPRELTRGLESFE